MPGRTVVVAMLWCAGMWGTLSCHEVRIVGQPDGDADGGVGGEGGEGGEGGAQATGGAGASGGCSPCIGLSCGLCEAFSADTIYHCPGGQDAPPEDDCITTGSVYAAPNGDLYTCWYCTDEP